LPLTVIISGELPGTGAEKWRARHYQRPIVNSVKHPSAFDQLIKDGDHFIILCDSLCLPGVLCGLFFHH
jgi:hypothetical protein